MSMHGIRTRPLHYIQQLSRGGSRSHRCFSFLFFSKKLHYIPGLQLLLDYGANPDAENDEGETPLNLVSRGYGPEQDCVGIARLLLERGVDVNARKKDKTTPLHSAAFEGMLKIARVLLDHGAIADAENDEGETPLNLVSRREYDLEFEEDEEYSVGIARLLLERGVDVNARKKNKTTPLHSAASQGCLKIAQVLLDHGANVDAEDDEGETPLSLVSRGGYDSKNQVRIARLLLERGVDVNARNKNKTTPLHSAAFWGRPEIAQVLLFLKKTKYHLYSGTTGAPRSWCKCERGE